MFSSFYISIRVSPIKWKYLKILIAMYKLSFQILAATSRKYHEGYVKKNYTIGVEQRGVS
jgi:hypothetical protein